MKTYESLVVAGKKVAKAGVIAASFLAIPYIYEGGCAYMNGYARAAEKPSVTSVVEEPANLEMILEN